MSDAYARVCVCIYSFESLEFHLSLLSSASLHSCTHILLPIFIVQLHKNNSIFDFSYRFARIFNGALKPYEINIRYALHLHLLCMSRCIQIQRKCQMCTKYFAKKKIGRECQMHTKRRSTAQPRSFDA